MATAAIVNTDKQVLMRDKRAQGIAAMGLVNREGDRFRVTTPSLRGRRSSYEVWRDEVGKVRCSCLEFEEESAQDAGFRCEHILAVKHSLQAKNSEPITKQPLEKPVAGAAAQKQAETPDTEHDTASEKRAEGPAEQIAQADTSARFGREPQPPLAMATIEKAAIDHQLTALADDTDVEEQTEMNKQHTAFAPEAPEQDLDFVTAEEHAAMSGASAPVVPLAFTNTLRQLRQPIDPKLVKTREGWRDRNGNTHMVEYVEWHTVADLLDRLTPTWSHSVRGIVQINDMVAVTAAITINGVTREGTGTGTADNETGIKKAEHDA
ncbi:MAG: SWIM zinc finger family protein, partial [Acidobacteria bacterium]|nr:SWIM zinc finger family protein [Acidobacteriota bacterium]